MKVGLASSAVLQRFLGLACAVALVSALGACSSDKPTPTPLETYTPAIAARQVWSARVASVKFALGIVARDGQFIVAGSDGGVVALQADTGRELWRGQAGKTLAAGVGSDGRFAAVVSNDNTLIVLDRGKALWTAALASRTATPPLVAGERVFVVGVDRAVHAFDALDGRRLWRFQRNTEPLTLAHPAVLASYKDTLLVGQGAVLIGLDPTKGTVRSEVALTPPRGTNEVERLNDLVGPLLRVGDSVCARAFQTGLGCVDMARNTLRWTRNGGGVQALGGDAELVFGADSSDRVSAWRAANGELAWTHDRLIHRALSAPLALPKAMVIGDFEGYVHLLSRDEGRTLQRLATDGSAVVGPPVLSGNTFLVATRSGGLFAFAVQ